MNTSLTDIGDTVTYKCDAGGLNWRTDQVEESEFELKCIEEPGNVVKWENPVWPTCTDGEHFNIWMEIR